MAEKITGKKLIQFVKDNPSLTKAELAEGAGFMRINKLGETVPDLKGFETELFAAHGTPIVQSRVVRSAAYETAVHASGIMLIGANYLTEFGVGPGDRFNIEIGEEGIFLRLSERVEGSPRPITKKSSKPKAAADAKPAEGGEATSTAQGPTLDPVAV